jgi:hypothetical protein
MNSKRFAVCGTLVVVGLASATIPALAAGVRLPAEQHEGSVAYVMGGIGKSDQMAMRRTASQFPLRIVFSERKDGEFIADVPVVITDSHGHTVFDLTKAGPMLDVRLPSGKYLVKARFKGVPESQEVTLDGKDARNVYFHWKGQPNA